MSLLSIAPMLDITDRHCRAYLRLFSPHIKLYTEMIHIGAILFGDRARFLTYNDSEHPLAIQFGGSDPTQLAQAAKIAEDWGYDEVNLNVGCPSDRVQAGKFGACLMAEPELVGECVAAMQAAVSVPVTVKHRIGIDDQDELKDLSHFVQVVRDAGCNEFIVHARKAWLKGLSPRQNREVPPLNYERVYALAAAFPDCCWSINGGIKTIAEAQQHLTQVDSVMLGRAAIENTWVLNQTDPLLYGGSARFQSRRDIVLAYCDYIESELAKGVWLKHLTPHLTGLYHGQPNAKNWRRAMSEGVRPPEAGLEVIKTALAMMAA